MRYDGNLMADIRFNPAREFIAIGNGCRQAQETDVLMRKDDRLFPNRPSFNIAKVMDFIENHEGNILDGIDPVPAISAGPGGGRHIITNNRIILPKDTALDIKAPGCLVEHNLMS